jgi:hypothetical protein
MRVKAMGKFAAATLLSLAIAGVLSVLPRNGGSAGTEGGGIAAFGFGMKAQLTEQNLVDRLSAIPLSMDIRRVEWNAPVLAVDFYAVDRLGAADIYRDLYKLSRFAVAATPNVEEVQVRVFGSGQPGKRESVPLLLSLDTRREETGALGDMPEDPAELRKLLESRCRLTFTRKWQETLPQRVS